MFAHSIRWRFQLWLGFLLVLVLSGFAVSVYQLQKNTRIQQQDEELQARVAAVSADLRRPPFMNRPGFAPWMDKPPPEFEKWRSGEGRGRPEPPPDRPGREHGDGPRFEPFKDPRSMRRELVLRPEVAALFDETRTNAYYYVTWTREETELKRSSNAPPSVPFPVRPDKDTRSHTRTRGEVREVFQFTERGDGVLVGKSMIEEQRALEQLLLGLMAAGGTVLAFGLGGGWLLATRAIRPVESISTAAVRISEGNLSERIVVKDPENELGRLGLVLNSTFARLEAAFENQKQFTADASHELRTPLAVIISEAQTTLSRERDAAEYKETVVACLEAAQQMRRLTDSLLELARFDAGQHQIQYEKLCLDEVARAALDRIRPLAREHQVVLQVELSPTPVAGDADRLGRVITNLLSNAIFYNKDNGEVWVGCRQAGTKACLTIRDTGQGIAEEDLPKVFNRFYRADKSRSRAHGRNGLGLAICKAIIDAHGGSIEVQSTLGQGTQFTVWLPLAV